MEPTPENFARTCEGLIGTPLHHRGRTRNGVDCVGVPIVALEAMGVQVEEPEHYGVIPDAALLEGYLTKQCRRITWDEVQRGDLLQTMVGKQGRHICVVTQLVNPRQVEVVGAVANRRRVVRTLRSRRETLSCWRVNLW